MRAVAEAGRTGEPGGAAVLQELAALRAGLEPGQRVAFVSGKFNILHPGHVRVLRFAAESADVVVAAITPDESEGVTVPASLRLDALRSIVFVHTAVLLDADLPSALLALRPDIVVKGKEFEEQFNEEEEPLAAYGGKLIFASGEVTFSTMSLLQKEVVEADFSSVRKPREFPMRHGFSVEELRLCMRRFERLKVLVVGDLIVDTYVTCDAIGMSQEDPTIVVTPLESRTFVGGAGIVAAHARGMGAQVRFVSVVGQDDKAKFAREALTGYGVEIDLLVDDTRPTTHKKRYRANGKTMLRVNELRQHGVSADLAATIVRRCSDHIAEADIVLFSDFNYGCLTQPVVDALTQAAKRSDALRMADSQASSQMADISRFRDMHVVTPTEREARLALGDFESGLSTIAAALSKKAGAENVLITLGAEGLLAYARDGGGEYMIDRLPAMNHAPKDVAGAGDSLFTATALALRSGASIWAASYLGALAAACQVSRVGNLPLSRADLVREIDFPEV